MRPGVFVFCAYLAVRNFSQLFHKRIFGGGGIIVYKMCDFIFFLNFCPKQFPF